MPRQKPGVSKQTYGTPDEFLTAVRMLVMIDDFQFDLAASAENMVVPAYYDETADALSMPWNLGPGWNWLNPPYGRAHGGLGAWTQKAWEEAQQGAKTAMLVPAAVGANWFKYWVWTKAKVLFLNGRITFVGETNPYPKDLMLLLYDEARTDKAPSIWTWQQWVADQAGR